MTTLNILMNQRWRHTSVGPLFGLQCYRISICENKMWHICVRGLNLKNTKKKKSNAAGNSFKWVITSTQYCLQDLTRCVMRVPFPAMNIIAMSVFFISFWHLSCKGGPANLQIKCYQNTFGSLFMFRKIYFLQIK